MHMIDWMADTDAPGAGVVLLSKLTRMFDFVYTIGGSSLTQRILPKFGFKFLGDACTWARPNTTVSSDDQSSVPRLAISSPLCT